MGRHQKNQWDKIRQAVRRAAPGQVGESLARMTLVVRALGLIWKAARAWTIAWACLLAFQGIVPAGIVYATKWLVDDLAAAVGMGLSPEAVQLVLWPALAMGGLLLLQQSLGSIRVWIETAQSELVQDEIKTLIHRKAVGVDYGFYESPDYLDLLQQANSQAGSRTLGLLQNTGSLLQNGITFLSIAAILASYGIWLPLILFVGTLPALFVVVRHNQRYHAWWKQSTRDRRWLHYLDLLFVEPTFAAEMRLYDLGDHFMNAYKQTRRYLRGEHVKLIYNQTMANAFAALVALLVTAGIMTWIVWRAFIGLARLGDIALFYQAINQGQTIMRSLLSSAGQIYTNTLFLEHLYKLIEMEQALDEPAEPRPFPEPIRSGVRFDNVTFFYPGSSKPALRNFSLDLPAGKLVAIVGANGAGKSTLTKLLCRFYDPQEGRVLIDGTDIRSFTKRTLRDHISIMFQLSVRFQATARENIALGRLPGNQEAILHAARHAKADEFIEQLPQQYETLLGRYFPGGTELSGGQWQRIALARAYMRDAPILVLDEPTSAMDSWAEAEWMRLFKRMMEGRSALIITHRFTTAMQADVIHVMDEGEIVESGTHQELLALGGRYAESWRAQIRHAEFGDVEEALGIQP